jgi:hypothetical protein
MRIDSCIEDTPHQKSNMESATDPSDSKPYEPRHSSQADRLGHSTPIAGEGYIDVTQLSTYKVSGPEECIFTSQATKDPVQRASQNNSTSPPTTVSPCIEKLVE